MPFLLLNVQGDGETTKDNNSDDKDIVKCYDKWDYIHLKEAKTFLVDFSSEAFTKDEPWANLTFSQRKR